ncbi:MAG: glycosyltransferase family 2 protein, partial [Myxococcota bacterium]
NDTVVAHDFLPPLLWALNADSRVAAVSSAILRMDHDDLLDVAYLSVYWGHGIVRHHGVNKFPGEGFVNRVDVDVAVGCSVLLSGEALADLGPLDAGYFAYHEEVDWCTRARRAGWRVLYQPLSRVWHAGSQSTGALATPLTVERRAASAGPELATPIALTWNPVRTYLGARNTVRFVRLNGRLRERLYFWLHSAYAVPLEALAAIMRQETALKIGAWSYRRALQLYARGDGIPPSPTPPAIGVRELLALPGVLLWRLPRDSMRAYREGRLAQIAELLRILWDGLLGRPLPLERLKLR